jgi:hypothetical protein
VKDAWPLTHTILMRVAVRVVGVSLLMSAGAVPLTAQEPSNPSVVTVPAATVPSNPIAIVPLDSRIPGSAAIVTGALQVIGGRAFIAANGTVTSGANTTEVSLPQRGMLRVCAATAVKIAADSSTPVGEAPGILMALDHGAVEASFATGRNADMILTPDFRILISAPGTANVKVRLGQGGDTCVDNPGTNAPYVLVTSVFDASIYRVQPGQRVMFQHGSLHEVVDQEKEPCGCPPAEVKGNDFPLAQSEGLVPLPPSTPMAGTHGAGSSAAGAQPLVFNAGDEASSPSAQGGSATTANSPAVPQTAPHKHSGLFARIGHFFRRLFGAE